MYFDRKRLRMFFFLGLMFVVVSVGVLAQEPAVPKADAGTLLKDFAQLSNSDRDTILSNSGLPQAGTFDLAKMLAYVIFGAVGFIAFIYGKKNSLWRPMLIGFALTVYPYCLSGTVLLYLVGAALTAALYFWRE